MFKDLLGIDDLTNGELELIIAHGFEMKKVLDQNIKKLPHLSGRSVALLFTEPCPEVSTSFEFSARFLSASVSSYFSGVGEPENQSILEIGKTLDSMMTDVIVFKSNKSGTAQLLARSVRASVVNAGDGLNEQPLEALSNIMTLKERFGDNLTGLKVVFIGDFDGCASAKSSARAMQKLGLSPLVCAPLDAMMRSAAPLGLNSTTDFGRAISDADVAVVLPASTSRFDRQIHRMSYLTSEKMASAKKDIYILNCIECKKGLEVEPQFFDSDSFATDRQTINSMAIKMATLYLLARRK